MDLARGKKMKRLFLFFVAMEKDKNADRKSLVR